VETTKRETYRPPARDEPNGGDAGAELDPVLSAAPEDPNAGNDREHGDRPDHAGDGAIARRAAARRGGDAHHDAGERD
jgi:hypothetical protein